MLPINANLSGGSSSAESKSAFESNLDGGGGFRQSPVINISQGSSSLRASTSAAENSMNWLLVAGGVAAGALALYLWKRR